MRKKSCLRRLPRGQAWAKATTFRKPYLVEKGGTMYGPYTKTAAKRAVERCGGRVVKSTPSLTISKRPYRRGAFKVFG